MRYGCALNLLPLVRVRIICPRLVLILVEFVFGNNWLPVRRIRILVRGMITKSINWLYPALWDRLERSAWSSLWLDRGHTICSSLGDNVGTGTGAAALGLLCKLI